MIVASIKDKDLAALYAKLSEILHWPENIDLFEVAIDQDGVRFRINSGTWTRGLGRREVMDSLYPIPPRTCVVDPIDDGPHVNFEA